MGVTSCDPAKTADRFPRYLLTSYQRNAPHPYRKSPCMGQIVALNRLLKQPQLEGLIASLARSFRALTE
ncbi:hypothetical protein BN874_2710001 [Candidatus Contendobacter odensis Run_B_J11]|uniref:Uncharacterized protein n=1 Tax=Candidatus Contendobacter odensis Run_B_J11 TaxID=1400861 RepID=A0A7U7GCH6_9GAMM|nr:hypothetical protein BN874_2710001 [Candidatus Contendobacter odensis Run_B_J11]